MIHSAKFVFALALFGFSSVATAKTRIGVTLGGFQSTESSFEDITYKTSGPSLGSSSGFTVGQQFTPNIEVGGSVLFSSITEESGESETTTTNTGAMVYLDYNFNPGENYMFFAGPRLGMSSNEVESGDFKIETTGTYYGAGGGMKYFLNTSVSFDTSVGYYMGTANAEMGGQESPDLDSKIISVGFGISAWL